MTKMGWSHDEIYMKIYGRDEKHFHPGFVFGQIDMGQISHGLFVDFVNGIHE